MKMFTLSQTAGAKLESAVNRNSLTEIGGKLIEWVSTGENMKLVAELMATKSSHEYYWHECAAGEKIKSVLAVHDLDDSESDIQFVGHRDLKEEMDSSAIMAMWEPQGSFEFKRRAVTMNQIREFHRQQVFSDGQLKVSASKETYWNVFPVIVSGNEYAVFIRYGTDGKALIKAGYWTDMKWDPGTRIFSTNQFRGGFG